MLWNLDAMLCGMKAVMSVPVSQYSSCRMAADSCSSLTSCSGQQGVGHQRNVLSRSSGKSGPNGPTPTAILDQFAVLLRGVQPQTRRSRAAVRVVPMTGRMSVDTQSVPIMHI